MFRRNLLPPSSGLKSEDEGSTFLRKFIRISQIARRYDPKRVVFE
jgi:hypothetical protein